MFTKQTNGKFEKWVESGLSTFEFRGLVAEIYFTHPWYILSWITLMPQCSKMGTMIQKFENSKFFEFCFFANFTYSTKCDFKKFM